MNPSASLLLEVLDLSVSYPGAAGPVPALREVTLRVAAGETVALVGETGCGKSTLALALTGLLAGGGRIVSGEILFEGRKLDSLGESGWRSIRGRKIALVFQEPRGALNPVLTVGRQLTEALLAHQPLGKREARHRAAALLAEVGLPDPEYQMKSHPLQLSGGMCQRVGIALAVANEPRLLVADEPLSALDPGLQIQILELLGGMKQRRNLGMIFISHDLALAAGIADRMCVMYAGTVVESGPARELISHAAHPYTRLLLECRPDFRHHRRRRPLKEIDGAAAVDGTDSPGCVFAPRCPDAVPGCFAAPPSRVQLSPTHDALCTRTG